VTNFHTNTKQQVKLWFVHFNLDIIREEIEHRKVDYKHSLNLKTCGLSKPTSQ
jgi:hypothetical protein